MSRIAKRLIAQAFRNDKWEKTNPDLEVWTTKGTLRAMSGLGYTRVRLTGESFSRTIEDLLNDKEVIPHG